VDYLLFERGLFTIGWFDVKEKYCSGWKFTIVYDQANRLHVLEYLRGCF